VTLAFSLRIYSKASTLSNRSKPITDLLELEEQHNDLLLAGHFKESLLDNIIITFEYYKILNKIKRIKGLTG
jgi:hypothetical protein